MSTKNSFFWTQHLNLRLGAGRERRREVDRAAASFTIAASNYRQDPRSDTLALPVISFSVHASELVGICLVEVLERSPRSNSGVERARS